LIGCLAAISVPHRRVAHPVDRHRHNVCARMLPGSLDRCGIGSQAPAASRILLKMQVQRTEGATTTGGPALMGYGAAVRDRAHVDLGPSVFLTEKWIWRHYLIGDRQVNGADHLRPLQVRQQQYPRSG
jgi:hypothetical protein